MKEYKQLGTYGLIIKDNKILLIHKNGGPYNGKLDLPGGTIEFLERPIETLKRELIEEVGIEVIKAELFDAEAVSFEWLYNKEIIKVHHVGIFYKVLTYKNDIKNKIAIDEINDDSLGAEFFSVNKLKRDELSKIAIIELEKLGYKLI